MKVVFDTNVLVSALVFPGGRSEEALRRIIEERDQLVISKPILDELLGILARKFSRDAEELAHVAVFLSNLALSGALPRKRDPNGVGGARLLRWVLPEERVSLDSHRELEAPH